MKAVDRARNILDQIELQDLSPEDRSPVPDPTEELAKEVIKEHKNQPKGYGVTYFAQAHKNGITKETAAEFGRGVADGVVVMAFEIEPQPPPVGNTLQVRLITMGADGKPMTPKDIWNGWMSLAEYLAQLPDPRRGDEDAMTPGQRAMVASVRDAKMKAHADMVRQMGGGDGVN